MIGEKKWSEVTQWYLTLCDPMICSLLGSSIHGIFQARILEWVAISFSKNKKKTKHLIYMKHSYYGPLFYSQSQGYIDK